MENQISKATNLGFSLEDNIRMGMFKFNRGDIKRVNLGTL